MKRALRTGDNNLIRTPPQITAVPNVVTHQSCTSEYRGKWGGNPVSHQGRLLAARSSIQARGINASRKSDRSIKSGL